MTSASSEPAVRPATATRPLVVFGGTFDPPHRAHAVLPLRAARLLEASTLLFLPTGRNPQKEHAPTDDAHRLRMLAEAIAWARTAEQADDDAPIPVVISRLELDRPGPHRTLDSLRLLRATHEIDDAPASIRLLIGADQAINFRSWHDWRAILDRCEPAILPREPFVGAALDDALDREHRPARHAAADPYDSAWWRARVLPLEATDRSSTLVRDLLAGTIDHEALDALLPPPVAAYILEQGLYRARAEDETARDRA